MRLFGRPRKETQAKDGEPRALAPRVRIDGRSFQIAQLDRTTLEVEGYRGDLIPLQRFHFEFLLPLGEEWIAVPTQGTVLRITGGTLAARYLAPQPYYQKFMHAVLSQSGSG